MVITGIDDHQLDNIPVGTCGAVVPTNKGEVIVILHEYALFGKGQSIHSSGQIKHFKNFVHDKSMKVGGLQCIITNDEYVMPLNFINGLPFLPMRPYTDEEWTKLPHVLLTADRKWDPRVLDGNIDDIEEWSAMFDHVVGDTAKAPKERPRNRSRERGGAWIRRR